MPAVFRFVYKLFALCLVVFIFWSVFSLISRNNLLKEMVSRLEADSRAAQVMVTKRYLEPQSKEVRTTIKFLEYDSRSRPLPARYFTFPGDIIQFQSLVIRFDDRLIKEANPLKGKSAFLFLKVFSLNKDRASVYDLSRAGEIPCGYKVNGSRFERRLWRKFWEYALDREKAESEGIRNAQIEAPGTRFLPGYIYTLRIEHDGGLRIDAEKIPDILKQGIAVSG